MSSLTYGSPMLPSSCASCASEARVFQVPWVSPVNAIAAAVIGPGAGGVRPGLRVLVRRADAGQVEAALAVVHHLLCGQVVDPRVGGHAGRGDAAGVAAPVEPGHRDSVLSRVGGVEVGLGLGHVAPVPHRLGAVVAQRVSGDALGLRVERVIVGDRGMDVQRDVDVLRCGPVFERGGVGEQAGSSTPSRPRCSGSSSRCRPRGCPGRRRWLRTAAGSSPGSRRSVYGSYWENQVPKVDSGSSGAGPVSLARSESDGGGSTGTAGKVQLWNISDPARPTALGQPLT